MLHSLSKYIKSSTIFCCFNSIQIQSKVYYCNMNVRKNNSETDKITWERVNSSFLEIFKVSLHSDGKYKPDLGQLESVTGFIKLNERGLPNRKETLLCIHQNPFPFLLCKQTTFPRIPFFQAWLFTSFEARRMLEENKAHSFQT